ncbi:XRE family transcriptional regulator [Bremerella cremea]|uniref:XRE family transcriptional regulator n=1 Tax=Bremerella cremea TaxID=1031537 RepID=A0A368KRZ0_9BACT|nr:helix-turn-helix transcriptional regulator [Bremerella cremea]RCS47655.1 XRE family transcriptional regulator [Bremerella cremea]
MQFGERVRELREARKLTQKALADRLGVSVSYISKVENEKLHFGDYPSEKFIHKLASELEADEDELLLLSDRVPPALRQRICERPDVFRVVAEMNEREMDQLVERFRRKS